MDIIKIEPQPIGGEAVNAVNARDLHAFLEVKKAFNSWVKVQIERAKLSQGLHFEVITQKGQNLSGGRPTIEYVLSIDAAKHIAMMCGTDKGCQVRDYFIECERREKSQPAIPDITDPEILLGILLKQVELRRGEQRIVDQQRAVIESQGSRLAAMESLSASDGSLCISDAAKAIGKRPTDVFAWLSQNRWIYKRPGCPNWIPYQTRVQAGFLEMKTTAVQRNDGSEKMVEQARVTPRGLTKLAELLANQSVNDPARIIKA